MHKLLVVFFAKDHRAQNPSRPNHLHRWSIVWRQPVFEPSLAWFRYLKTIQQKLNANLPKCAGVPDAPENCPMFFSVPNPFESQVKTAKPKKAAAPAAAFGAMAPAVPQVDKAWRDAASKWGHFPNIGWLEPRKLNKKMMVSIFFWYFFRFFWGIIPTLWFYWCLFLGIGLNYSHLPIDFNQCLTPFWGLCSFSTRLLSTESERLLRAANQPSGLTLKRLRWCSCCSRLHRKLGVDGSGR